ncbi:AlpA family phage regulatory protein [Pseudomonas phytophila]|uniref:AlpA family phage regulatory protein n=1 Tax=Pseudomonas phytophila TaxID=2867264 RepID=A0ABY6FL28_9PSED|nr:AlpA family phage regulatory protein [Pseudomonas phytophila]UXZ98349.1 AlpA family phage regulatory protein [Pseudomonas phytophila]
MNTARNHEQIEFIRLPAVNLVTGISTSKIYDMANKGTFPSQAKLGGRAVAWVKSEVLEWSKAQVSAARARKDSDKSPAASLSK